MALKPKKTQAPTTPTASSTRQNGGHCCALCKSPSTPITEDRSSILYVLDLTIPTPTVLDLFQFHSCEYAPRYTTTINKTPQQCTDQFNKTLQGLKATGIVTGTVGKTYEIGILTGITADMLELIEKCYQVLPQSAAANTITRIRSFQTTSTSPTNKIGTDKKTIIVFKQLLDFVAEYKLSLKNKQSTDLVIETHSENQYSVRFVNNHSKFIIPKILIDKPRFSHLTGEKLSRIINRSIITI